MNLTTPLRIALLTTIAMISCLSIPSAQGETVAEPGPESGGIRLRFTATPRQGQEGFEVRLDLLNVSQEAIQLRTGWESMEEGSVREYLQAVVNLETTPAFAPEHGATGARQARTAPQKTERLAAGETLSLRWQTSERRLKASDAPVAIFGGNPLLEEPGLYSAHVVLTVPTAAGPIRLRSNEQLVSVGGSLKAPKSTAGRIQSVSRDHKSAMFDLGSLDQVATGDQFDISSKTTHWRLTITTTSENFSEGNLKLLSNLGSKSPPTVGEWATRVRSSAPPK